MSIALYPGTFDPVTWSHLDIIKRAAKLVDKLIVAVAINSEKTPLIAKQDRLHLLQTAIADELSCQNIMVVAFNGLMIDFARQVNAKMIIRGLRAVSDYDYEFQIVSVNQKLAPEIEGVFLMAHEKYHFISSSVVKSVAKHQGDISAFVPPVVVRYLQETLFTIK